MTLLATRRAADDLQILLDGGRPRSPRATDELGPLVTLATSLRPAAQTPRPEFREALRERLLTEATPQTPAAPQTSRPQRRSVSWRLRQLTATVAAAAVVAGAGAALASTRALPGDTLYGLKRQIEQVQLDLARGDVARGTELLDQADARLSEAESLAAAQHGPRTEALISRTLTDLAVAFTLGADELTRAYRDSGDAEPLRVLDRFVAGHRERLADLIDLLNPTLRAQARELAQQFAEVQARLAAVLASPSSLAPAAGAIPIPEARPDATRDVTAARRAAAMMSGQASAGGVAGTESAVGGLLDSLGGTAGTDSGSTSSSSGGGDSSDGLLGALTGEAGTTSGPRPTTAPLPVTTLLPSPIQSPLPTEPVGEVTSALRCVPVPPLTTCP